MVSSTNFGPIKTHQKTPRKYNAEEKQKLMIDFADYVAWIWLLLLKPPVYPNKPLVVFGRNRHRDVSKGLLGGGFKDFLFSPLFGEDSHFD